MRLRSDGVFIPVQFGLFFLVLRLYGLLLVRCTCDLSHDVGTFPRLAEDSNAHYHRHLVAERGSARHT